MKSIEGTSRNINEKYLCKTLQNVSKDNFLVAKFEAVKVLIKI